MRKVALASTLALLGLFFVASCGEEASPGPVPRKDDSAARSETPAVGPKVVFLGDSITAGLHLDGGLEDAFPAILARSLAERGLPIQVVNAGLSGDTSAGGLRRLDWVMKQEPDLLVIELGGNDALRGQDLDEIARNMAGIVAGARARGAEVLLLGMLVPPSLGETYATGFRELYADLAEREKVMFVSDFMKGVGGVPDLNYRDGLHPNAEGHRLLAARLQPGLEAWLEGMKTRSEPAKIAR